MITTERRIATDKVTKADLTLFISTDELQNVDPSRGPGVKGTVTDLVTKKRYRISGKSCGLPRCYCAWWAKEVAK